MLTLLLLAVLAVPPPHRVAVYTGGDPTYAALAVPASVRIHPEAPMRLVVFRDGAPILDRGLLDRRDAGMGEKAGILEERGLIEEAIVALDGSAALLRATRYVDRVSLGAENAPNTLRGRERVTWIDPDRPGGRWSVDFPEGRFVKEAIVAPLGLGAAVILTDSGGLGGEVHLFGPDGKPLAHIAPPEAEAVDVAAAADSGVLAIDLAYPPNTGSPDRGIVVYDLAAGTHWRHTWSYGAEDEIQSWELEPGGALVVHMPGKVRRFSRDGTPQGSSAPQRGPFNRIREGGS